MITDNRKNEATLPQYLKKALPQEILSELEELPDCTRDSLEEIRLRVGKFAEYKTSSVSRRGK